MKIYLHHFKIIFAVFLGLLFFPLSAQAANDKIAICKINYPGDSQEAKDKRYACFSDAENPPPSNFHLDWLWPAHDDNTGIVAYKQSYLLINQTDIPNQAPTSPNVKNQATPNYPYEQQEAKFQFSLKSQYPHYNWMGESNSVWFGYTQQSHWQVLNGPNSRPFRENNFEPEPLIISHQFERRQDDTGLSPRFLNFGVVHQSNGQSLPFSRSWNRVYLQLGLEKRLGADSNIAVTIRPWVRIQEDSATDDNPDIEDYLGHGDLELLYWNSNVMVTALLRSRSQQFDFSWSREKKSLHWHLQLFNGYGESLIDYNQQHSVIGVGISLPYDLDANSK